MVISYDDDRDGDSDDGDDNDDDDGADDAMYIYIYTLSICMYICRAMYMMIMHRRCCRRLCRCPRRRCRCHRRCRRHLGLSLIYLTFLNAFFINMATYNNVTSQLLQHEYVQYQLCSNLDSHDVTSAQIAIRTFAISKHHMQHKIRTLANFKWLKHFNLR